MKKKKHNIFFLTEKNQDVHYPDTKYRWKISPYLSLAPGTLHSPVWIYVTHNFSFSNALRATP